VTTERVEVRKTYKLFIGGGFPRSESGRSYQVKDSKNRFLANAAMGSRKDARDAVRAARAAYEKWSKATAYNRGQILYRIAEMMEGRKDQFIFEMVASEGCTKQVASKTVDAAIDRWVWYAGWSDKYATVAGSTNPVAGPYYNFSTPIAIGVVAVVAPAKSSLLGLVSVIAPSIVMGATAVVVASEKRPLPAITLSEAIATSDLPGGVINILTGSCSEIAPWLASHGDVNGLDLTGVTDTSLAVELTQSAAGTIKRVFPRQTPEPDWFADPGLTRLDFFTEVRTVWHPIGV
jgi:acyl-CoA reductase-like NAD-dependent aldehyde dehydrogenase